VATARIFNHYIHTAFYRLALIDGLMFFAAFYLGAYIYFIGEAEGLNHYVGSVPFRAISFALISITCLFAMGLYQPRMREGASGILLRTSGAFVLIVLAMSVIFYVMPDLHLWRGIFFYTVLVSFTGCLINRLVFNRLADAEQLKKRVLVYGSGPAASTISTAMRRNSDRQGFSIVGFVRVDNEPVKITTEKVIELDQSLSSYSR
jgi:FlaA1/EpsC-like NDP-sugar epimerase